MSAFQLRNVSCGRVHIRASHPWYPSPALGRTRWPCHAGSVRIRGYNVRPLLETNRGGPQPHGLMDDSSLGGKTAEIGRACLGMECVTACIPKHALSVRWRSPAVPLALVFRSQRTADGPNAPSPAGA